MTKRRTPPTEKWLLNELAAAVGDLAKIRQQIEQLEKEAQRLHQTLAAQTALCTSLETALQLAAGPVDSSGLVVKVHRSYGGRGSLRNWLRRTLKESAPLPIDSKTLLNQAMAVLGLVFTSKAAQTAYYANTFRRQLWELRNQGDVERLTLPGQGPVATCWRWKAAPGLEDLRQQVKATTVARADCGHLATTSAAQVG